MKGTGMQHRITYRPVGADKYEVHADREPVGYVIKVEGGWEGFSPDGELVALDTSRLAAAEELVKGE